MREFQTVYNLVFIDHPVNKNVKIWLYTNA